MKTRMLMVLAVAAVLVLAIAPGALAQGCGGSGWGYGYLYQSLDYNVPYFAAHPPVYYSYPVPRTYGYSPFAYPPSVMTPEVIGEPVEPAVIVNPYVPSSGSGEAAEPQDRTTEVEARASAPLVIVNPYVAGSGTVARAQ